MSNIELSCKKCQKIFTVLYKHRNRKFCSRECVNLYQTGENNPSFGMTYRTKETHPEWAQKVSTTHQERGHISGEKNPMKNKNTATKMGDTRSKRFQKDEKFRQMTADLTRKAWEDGKFDGISVGKCKWHNFIKKDGENCKLQGTWEVAYAIWLEKNNISFIPHKGRIPYLDDEGKIRSYYPDFYLPDTDEYIDIKNQYHYSLSEGKWEKIRASNPHLKIILLFEKDLKEKGVL